MTATTLTFRSEQLEALTWSSQAMLARMGIQPKERRCPACDSIIYSRRHAQCGACGKDLPEHCRFNDGEARRIENLVKTERERHLAWLKKNRSI